MYTKHLKRVAVAEIDELASEFRFWLQNEGIFNVDPGTLFGWFMDVYPQKANDKELITSVWNSFNGKPVLVTAKQKEYVTGYIRKVKAVSFGDPFAGQAKDSPISTEELIRAIRFTIAAEYEAVQLYTQLAESTDNKMAQTILKDIAEEEIVHAGEFMKVLKELSPEEASLYEKGENEVIEKMPKNVSSSKSRLLKQALEGSPGTTGFTYEDGPEGKAPVKLDADNQFIQKITDKIKEQIASDKITPEFREAFQAMRYSFVLGLKKLITDIVLNDDVLIDEIDLAKDLNTLAERISPEIKSYIQEKKELMRDNPTTAGKEKLDETINKLEELINKTGVQFDLTSKEYHDEFMSFSVIYQDEILALGSINFPANEVSITLFTDKLTPANITKVKEILAAVKQGGFAVKDQPILPGPKEQSGYNIPLYVEYEAMLKKLVKEIGIPYDKLKAALSSVMGATSRDISNNIISNPQLMPVNLEPVLKPKLIEYVNKTITDKDLQDFVNTLGGKNA